MSTPLDTERLSTVMRARGVDRSVRRVRITNFHGSQQEQDFTLPANCGGFGRVRHFRRETASGWPPNPLPIVPAARALGVGDELPVLEAQVFQNAVCNWRCWYCFVDFELLSGNAAHSEWKTADELIALYEAQETRPPMLDLSGGQPDLTPEWVPWMMEALERAGLAQSVYVWSDDNLSNDYFWRYLSTEERQRVFAHEMYGKVCCFKGFDQASFAFNTRAAPDLFDRQFDLMSDLLTQTPLDMYAYVTLTATSDEDIDAAIVRFVDRIQNLDPALPLRTVPLRVTAFSPVHARMGPVHTRALAVQEEAIAAWNEELIRRFTALERAKPICDVRLRGG